MQLVNDMAQIEMSSTREVVSTNGKWRFISDIIVFIYAQ